MSFPVSLKLQIEGDAEVQSKIQSINQELSGLGKGAGQATRPMSQMSKSMDNMGKSSDKAGKSVSEYGEAQAEVAKSTQKATVTQRTMGQRVQQVGSGMTLAGSAAIGLWNAYDNITDSAQKVTIAEGRLEGAERRLSVAREQLNKLQQSGTASALDLQQAQQGVAAAEAMVERANLGLTNSQEALNEAWLNAATNLIPNVFTGITGLSQVYQGLTSTVDEQIAAYVQQAAAVQESGIAITEATGNTLEFTETTTELAGAATESGAAVTELGANFTEVGSAATEMGSTVAEAGADIGEFAGDATELGGSLVEVGSTAIESGANLAEFGGDAVEAAGAVTELGADIAEFSGDTLEFSGNVLELGGAAAETSADMWQMGNDIGTMGGALVEAEAAALLTGQALRDAGKGATGLLGIISLLTAGLAFLAGAFEGVNLHAKNFGNLQTMNDQLARSIDAIIPGFYNWSRGLAALADPTEEQIANLGDMLPGLKDFNKWLTGTEDAAEGAGGALGDELNPAIEQTNATLNELPPAIQQAAAAWGLYNNEAAATDPVAQKQIAYLQNLDKSLEPARQGVIDLATANGVDLKDALAMTDEQMIGFLLTSENLGPTLQQQAEMSAQAAKEFGEAWMTSFEQVSEAQREFGNTMRSAMGKMGQELGEEMEVGLSDLEKKVSKGLVGFSDQFFEEIFPEDFLATAMIEGNDPDDIADELKDLMDDVVDEDIISKDQAKGLLQPMIDYFEQDLPGDVEAPLAYMAGQLPGYLADWQPAIVNGVVAVGAAGKKAVDEHIMQPMLQGLQGLESGASGLDFGRSFLANIRASLPQIEQEAGPEVAEMLQGLLDAKNLGLDQKVQGIIDIMDQIRPGFKETIMGMDQDADGIADIFDDKVLSPADEMKRGLLEAFGVVYNALAEIDPKFQPVADAINGALGSIENTAGTAMEGTIGHINEMTGEFESADTPIVNALNTIREKGFRVIERSADGTKVKIQSLSDDGVTAMVDLKTGVVTNSDGSVTSLEGLGAAADSAKGKIDALMQAAKVKQDQDILDIDKRLDALAGPGTGRTVTGETMPAAPPPAAAPAAPPKIPAPDFSAVKTAWDQFATWLQTKTAGISTQIGGWVQSASVILASWNFSGVKTTWDGLWTSHIKPAMDTITANLGLSKTGITNILSTWNWSGLSTSFNALWSGYIKPGIDTITTNLGLAKTGILNVISTWDWSGLSTAFNAIWPGYIKPGIDAITTNIGLAKTGITNVISTWDWSGLKAAWETAAGHVRDGVSWISTSLNTLGMFLDQHFRSYIGQINAFGALITPAFGPVKTAFDGLWTYHIKPGLDVVVATVGPVWEAIKQVFSTPIDFAPVQAQFNSLWINNIKPGLDAVVSNVAPIWQAIKTVFTTPIDFSAVGTAFNSLWTQHVQPGISAVQTNAGFAWEGIKGLFRGEFDFSTIKTAFDGLWPNVIAPGIATVTSSITSVWGGIVNILNGIKDRIQPFFDLFTSDIPTEVDTGLNQTTVDKLDSFTGKLAEELASQGTYEPIRAAIATFFGTTIPQTIGTGVATASNVISSWMRGAQQLLGTWDFSSLTTAFGTGASGFLGRIQAGVNAAKDWITNTAVPALQGAWQAITDIFGGLFAGPQEAEATSDPTAIVDFEGVKAKWADLAKAVNTHSTNMSIYWLTHTQNIQNYVNTFVLPAMISYQSLFTGMVQAVLTNTTNMSAFWYTHAASVGATIALLRNHFTTYGTYLAGAANTILTQTTQWSAYWLTHAASVSASVNIIGGQHLSRMAQGYQLLANAILIAFNNIIANWRTHATNVSAQVNTIGGTHLARLAAGYQLLANSVLIALNHAIGSWRRHTSAVTSAVSSGVSSVNRLAAGTASAMSRIVSSMNTATGAANRLRTAINSLQSRTITVTTRYRSVGSPGGGGGGGRRRAGGSRFRGRAQHGFHGIVTQPTTLLTGEGNRPELVQVTPLSPNASGEFKMNQAAFASTFNAPVVGPDPIIRAGKGKRNKRKKKKKKKRGKDKDKDNKRVDSVFFSPTGKVSLFFANGIQRSGYWRGVNDFNNKIDWHAAARKKAGDIPGLKNSEVTLPTRPDDWKKRKKGQDYRDKPKETFQAERYAFGGAKYDPLLRHPDMPGAMTGRGGKSLMDLRFQSGARGDIMNVTRMHGKKPIAWITDELRYEDGSFYRRFANGAVQFGQDIFRLNTKYLKGSLKSGSSVKEVKYYENGKAEVTYYGITDKEGKDKIYEMRHNHPGPFTSGSKKSKTNKKGRYTTKVAKHGYSGIVRRPTEFLAGEGGKSEFVDIRPMSGGWGGGRGGRGRGEGRPIIVQLHSTIEVDKRAIAKAIQSEVLGGIFTMS